MHKHRLLIKFGHATKHSIVVKIKKIPFFSFKHHKQRYCQNHNDLAVTINDAAP